MNAIDLYSGIGGWTLGLKLAGVNVECSYEWWNEANSTHNKNFGTTHREVDIRQLKLSELPEPGTIDIVVGSPPCTQFSFSNRGGNGDIQDGLKDISKFLEIVEFLKPKFWAMENVPRVAKIISREILPKGQLYKFKHLIKVISVVDASEFGLPQRRKRMIAGDFPYDLFNSYKSITKPLTLGDVIQSLDQEVVVDPIYNYKLSNEDVTDHIKEPWLTGDELRMNRESKTFHPVYNKMSFPDKFGEPSRTITAVCTRVSRESVVIKDKKNFRRLTVRERGVLQSFPITYQFYGKTYSSRLKMIGNAIPPLLTYYLANAMSGTKLKDLKPPSKSKYAHKLPAILPPLVKPDSKGKNYSLTRKFRAAIPQLRFGSGMRFEFENTFNGNDLAWKVNFFYGTSKQVQSIELCKSLYSELIKQFKKDEKGIKHLFKSLEDSLNSFNPELLQKVWVQKSSGLHPYNIVDLFGETSSILLEIISQYPDEDNINITMSAFGHPKIKPPYQNLNGMKKVVHNCNEILSGLIIGSWFNSKYSKN